jgi:hypothetical protein
MRYYYAKLAGARCVSVLDTHQPIDAPDMLPIQAYQPALIGQLYDEQTGTFSPDPAPAVPQAVTMRQARLALLGAGKLAQVDAAIAALTEPTRTAAQIEWEYSNEVQRHNGIVSQLGPALGLTDAQIDALFVAAAAL